MFPFLIRHRLSPSKNSEPQAKRREKTVEPKVSEANLKVEPLAAKERNVQAQKKPQVQKAPEKQEDAKRHKK